MALEVQYPGTPQSLIGGTAGSVPVNPVPSTPVSGTAAVNTQVQVTIAGVASQAIRLTSLSWSYSGAPTGGTVTVVVNAVTILQLDIAAAGPGFVELPPGGLECALGQSAVITLTAAGAAVVGRLNVSSYNGS